MLGQRIANRYEILQMIGQGGMGIVYKAHDRLMGQTVALKSVQINKEAPTGSKTGESTLDLRVNIAQEFRTLASLRHPHIVGVLDYGFDHQSNPFITMELLDTSSNILRFCKSKSFEQKLQALAEMLQALAYLHRRNIIHRDLKPDNVSVINKTVKLLDFGLATAREHLKKEADEESDTLRGTLAYMPPEIFDSAIPSETTDLYALGLIAYEIFSGAFPYNTKTINTLIQDIMQLMPDVDLLDVPESLRSVIQRLLMKDPSARYNDANAVLSDMQDLLGNQGAQNLVQIRESYLQAAEFVGREKELSQLQGSLQKLKDGFGAVWLVAGEAGVGKSRLVEEFRIQALVKGLTVLRGQAVSDQGQSYQLWREPLRRYLLSIDPDSASASILKTLIPELPTLLDRPLHDAPDLDPQATHQRLLTTIEELFSKATEPVVIVLEDLHWADSESLELLARFERIVHKAPVVVVASLRNDESDVSAKFPQFNKLSLARFDEREIQALSASMIGQVGKSEQVIQLLQRETEGNAFFLVEVVRTLAEEAGDFESIAYMTLPQAIFAGGVQKIIENRLGKVPENAMEFLRLAAIHGRVLDIRMLEKAFGSAVEDYLLLCSEAAVLDVIDEKWRFAHDKLRDGILSRLTEAEKVKLHQEAAEALEAAYPNDATQAVTLANHWNKAGNQAKEYRYGLMAGEQALKEGANSNAINYLLRAKSIMPANLSDKDRAQIERNLGSAYYGLGEFKQVLEHDLKALDLLGWGIPKSDAGFVLGIFKNLGKQILHRRFPKYFFGNRKQYQDTIRSVHEIHYQLTTAFAMDNMLLPSFFSAFHLMNLAENAAIYSESAYGSATLGYMMNMMRLRGVAKSYGKMAQDFAQKDPESLAVAGAYNIICASSLAVGNWSQAYEMAQAALKILNIYRHERYIAEATIGLIDYYYAVGDYETGLKTANDLYERSIKSNDIQTRSVVLALKLRVLLRRNQMDEAAALGTELDSLLQQKSDSATKILAYGGLALLYQRCGERAKSIAALEAFVKSTQGTQPVIFYIMEGIANATEAALALLKDARGEEKTRLESLLKSSFSYFGGFAGFFPFARPQLNYWQGMIANYKGDRKKAMNHWQKALGHAIKLVMLYDEALIQLTMAQYSEKNAPDYSHRLSRAVQIFKKLGANYYLEQTV